MNPVKQLQSDLYQKAFAENPDFSKSKKKIGLLMLAVIALRVIFSITETVFCLDRNLSISNCIVNYAAVAVVVLFAYFIYKGTKPLLYLVIAGGVYSVGMLFLRSGSVVLENLKLGDVFYNFYVFTLIIVCFFQVVISFYILLNKKFNVYFSKMAEINKTVMAQMKEMTKRTD